MRFADTVVEVPIDTPWHFVTGSIVMTFGTIAVAVLIRWCVF